MNAPAQTAPKETAKSSCQPIQVESRHHGWQIEESQRLVIIRGPQSLNLNPEPKDWHARIESYFQTIPNLAVVGTKQLTANGLVAAFGEFIIHPKGFHHLGRGLPATCYRFPEEVDVIAGGGGGLLVVDRAMFESAGGLKTELGDLAALDLCLKLRLAGGRCVAVPDVVIEVADELTLNPTPNETSAFREHWGFDWRAPDLEAVHENYPGTGLLWNVRFWGRALPFEKYVERPAVHWTNYVKVECYRERADHLINAVASLTPTAGLAVDLGCGDGLFTHLLALRGYQAVGIDPEEAAIAQAQTHTQAHQTYPSVPPRFKLGNGAKLPFEDESADTVFMLDVIEHLPNPIRILKEAARILKPGGHLFVTTPAAEFGKSSDPTYHLTEYSPAELENQLNAVPRLNVTSRGSIGGIYRDIMLAARRK